MVLELERMRARHGMCGKDHSPSRLDAFVKSLEEERNYYKEEVERYRLVRGRTDRSPTPVSRGRSPRGRGSWHGKVREALISIITCMRHGLSRAWNSDYAVLDKVCTHIAELYNFSQISETVKSQNVKVWIILYIKYVKKYIIIIIKIYKIWKYPNNIKIL